VAVVFGRAEDLSGAAPISLDSEIGGYWGGFISSAQVGMDYRFHLDNWAYPDPAARFQPRGPHGVSRIVDPATYQWSDTDWRGVERAGQVIYEMHIGTFTSEGTWAAAMEQLAQLAELGITLLEVMPVADFPGRYGWGYDGVNLFAPTRLYGEPDDFRRFIDRAHGLGLGVILDVVYNHLGPDGNYLKKFAPHYFSERYKNEWGDALNFDDAHSGPVRELFIANAGYWIEEFHLDGLRLDATQQIFDHSEEHLLTAVARRVREAARGRGTYLVAENETQDTRLVRESTNGGCDLDALWNDDFHHTAIVAMTGRNEAYYTDYHGSPQEFISAAKWGFLYQGQRYKWQKTRRGSPAFDLAPTNFVNFLQNHDQIANSLVGKRIHTVTSAGRLRALTTLLLLGPNTPMLFQGQEFAASTPFLYFADHNADLAKAVAAGRSEFLKQFPSIASGDAATLVPNPEIEETFLRCKLNFADRERHPEVLQLHRDLLRLRKEDPLLGKARRGTYDGAVLGATAFVLRFFGESQNDRLLLINLGPHLHLDPAPEPLLAPPFECQWVMKWSSEDPSYGGSGTPPLDSEDNWHLPAESGALLVPVPL
jgi:maltooligosyltrehalose trehalohydrolase